MVLFNDTLFLTVFNDTLIRINGSNDALVVTAFNDILIQMSRVFTDGPGEQGSILGRVIPKTQKIVLDATLLITQHYKVRIKGKVEQSRE